MQFVGLNKYLMGFGLLTALNVPLFLYSQSLLRSVTASTAAALQEEPDSASTSKEDSVTQKDAMQDHAEEKTISKEVANEIAEEDVDYQRPMWIGYKPPLLSRCKRLYDKYLKEELEPRTYKSFAYSFDGSTAACATSYSPRSQRHADTAAIKECAENNQSTKKIAACRIYILNKSSQP